jgi:hypothetical protein
MGIIDKQMTKRRFIPWPPVKMTKDSSNLIGRKQKFIHWIFTLEANNTYMATLFGSFGTKSLYGGRMYACNINRNPNFPYVDKFFFLNLDKVPILYSLCSRLLECFKKNLCSKLSDLFLN